MSLSALRLSSMMYKGSYISYGNRLHRPLLHRTFANIAKQEKEGVPPHLIRKGKRRIPEPYLKILKQVPPRHKGI